MAEVEDAMPPPPTTTESEGTTTDEDVHLSPTCVCRGSRSDDGCGRIKLRCSFGGRIVPQPKDGALKYVGGETRVLAVPRSIPFREMKKKLEEMFNTEVAAIKYQLLSLNEDLDVLVSVTCDDDLVHMLDEYERLEAKRSPTLSPRFRVYVFGPQTSAPLPAAAPASSLYAGSSHHHNQQHPHHYHQPRHHFQPERYVATVPVTPSESPRYPAPSYGTVSAGNSPRANATAPERPPVFEKLGMQRVRSSPNLGGSLVDAASPQHLHHHAAADGGGGYVVSGSPGNAGAGSFFFLQHTSGHHYQHQYPAAPVHVPHPAGAAGARYVRVGNYLAPPMVPVVRSSDRPVSRGGPMPHGGETKAALVWD